uniref:Protein MNN4-like n=1 Tax=Cucumis melo TaxID=3656 RepID=A0A9I9DKY7_CUCME
MEEGDDDEEEKESSLREKGITSLIAETEFEIVTKKALKKTEQVKSGLLKMKVMAQGIKTLAEGKLETKMKEREEL